MPGMMDTILNLGLNEEVVETLAKASGNPRWAWDCYRRFIQKMCIRDRFSAAKGGLVCNECDGEVRDGMFLDGSTLYTMQYIESSTIEKLAFCCFE